MVVSDGSQNDTCGSTPNQPSSGLLGYTAWIWSNMTPESSKRGSQKGILAILGHFDDFGSISTRFTVSVAHDFGPREVQKTPT